MIKKRTIGREISFSGMGIHSGQAVSLTLKPAPSGRIVFSRLDRGGCRVEVDPWRVDAGYCSTLVEGDCMIRTVEHLLAVLYILGIDNLEIDLDGEEIPILDGSALPIAEAILDAGLREIPGKRKTIRLTKPYTLHEGEASLSFRPDPDFKLTYIIDFSHPAIGRQMFSSVVTREGFLAEIAPARTFGFLKDVAELWRKGLAKGGNLDNAIVLDENKVISGPLRFADEFVRHKVLDLIGDLALLGHPLLGHFQAERAGHRLHLKAVHFLLEHPEFWTFEEMQYPRFLED